MPMAVAATATVARMLAMLVVLFFMTRTLFIVIVTVYHVVQIVLFFCRQRYAVFPCNRVANFKGLFLIIIVRV